jgi:aminoglycoside phosphotransferase (APT) family kinase protein
MSQRPEAKQPPQRSSRDPEELRRSLEAWLGGRLGADARPTVAELHATSTNGMSSETVLFDAAWSEAAGQRDAQLVARLAPDAADVPVFPEYDLWRQFEVIRLVGEITTVPVPEVLWLERDAGAIGSPFFVMARVEGVVPPDVMPYNFGDTWLYDASPEDQQRLQDSTVDVLARLHEIDGDDPRVAFLAFETAGDTPLARHLAHTEAWYEFVAVDGRSDLVERTFRWLRDHWPAEPGPARLCWGDSRIGNVLYRDFAPVAVLDWEMAALGPRELDVAWSIYGHRMFEDIAATYELGGMPHFFRRDDIAARYEALTGHTPRDLDWYGVYSAVQYAIVFLRIGRRSIHFGERDEPPEIDDLIMNREPLERMLAGTYWN